MKCTRRSLVYFSLAAFAIPRAALAQTPPSAAELAAYRGLHRAAHAGDIAAIRDALRQGADPNGRDGAGRTPLHVACFARQAEAMRLLVAQGADPKAMEGRAYDCVTIASVADDDETLRVALAIGGDARQITSPYNGTALTAAAHLGHAEVVQVLIDAGAPLDHVNNLGWTALIESVVLGDGGPRHTETARRLVQAGARRDIADRNGQTPLDLARARGYAAMVEILTR
ncbi:MAG: ankyrin repeat domain-containing protein [Phreatobacter sp.]|nr:ankyrin repeat domain-containing protein [Phreatobacter sp.]